MSKENFEELVERYSRQVLNVALRVIGNAESAHDVHQEVFLAIWRRWHKYNGQTNWNGYLYRTTIRKAIEFAKRSRTESLLQQHKESYSDKENPDNQLRTVELQEKLLQKITRLPKRQADVFVLSRIEGFKHDKIAEVLGCSQQTVRVHLHRAVKKLVHELGDYLVE